MDPEGRCSAMALVLSDAEMNSQPQEELLVHMDELRECIELMEKAQKIQEKTVARLKQDLSFMEDVSQEISNNIIAFQGTHESLFFMNEAVLAEEGAQKAAEKAGREAQEAQDALLSERLEDFIKQEGIPRDKAVYLLSPPAKKQKISE